MVETIFDEVSLAAIASFPSENARMHMPLRTTLGHACYADDLRRPRQLDRPSSANAAMSADAQAVRSDDVR